MQEVLEKIKDKCQKKSGIGRSSLVAFLEILNEVEEECNNGWIPVEDGLPKNNKPVLCWVKSTTIASGETYIIGSLDNGFWFLQAHEIGRHSFPVRDYRVIAWQPLPEPYRWKSEKV